MPQGKKTVTKGKANSKSSSEQNSSEQEQQVQEVMEQEVQDAPVVTNWSRDSNHDDSAGSNNGDTQDAGKPSVLDFNRDEVAGFENKTVSELSITQLLQVLVRRGEVQENITVRKECGILMKKLHGERFRKNPRRFQRRGPPFSHQQFVPVEGGVPDNSQNNGFQRGAAPYNRGGYNNRGSRGRGDYNPRFRRGGFQPDQGAPQQ